MLVFLGLVGNMGVINLPYVKDYWSREFVCRVPFFGEYLHENILQIFWMLPETVSSIYHSLRCWKAKVSSFLKYIDPRCREHIIPGQDLVT
jgi:hypothetical protein